MLENFLGKIKLNQIQVHHRNDKITQIPYNPPFLQAIPDLVNIKEKSLFNKLKSRLVLLLINESQSVLIIQIYGSYGLKVID